MNTQTSSVPKKKRVVTSFEIGNLKEPWEQYCIAHGVSSGDALCQIIQKITADTSKISQHVTKHAKVKQPQRLFKTHESTEKKQHRLYLTLTESEFMAIQECAQADGFQKGTTWATALIRAHLTDQAQFGMQEIKILGESNHQLLAIGRNLNQIAKAMNSVKGDRDEYEKEVVEELAKAVRLHVKKVGDALRASIFRWKLS